MDKNILLVSNMYPNDKYPHYGVFVKNIYEILYHYGYDVDKVVLNKHKFFLIRIFGYLSFYFRSFIKSLFGKYQFVYVHFISLSTFGVFLPLLFKSKVRLVLNVHGNDIVADRFIDKLFIPFSKLFLKRANKIVCPSSYFQKILIDEYHVDASKIVIYPAGGVDTQKFIKMEKESALKTFNLNSNFTYFGYISRLEKDKGYDTLLAVIQSLKNQGKLENTKFLIVGDGKERSIFEKLVREYSIEDKIIHWNFLDHNQLVYALNAIDALIYPTRRKSESLGLIGLEAMSCGTIVIGSCLYGPSSYLTKKNSIPIDTTRKEELETAILRFMTLSEQEKNRMRKEARRTSQEYDTNSVKDILIDLFKK